MDYFINKIDIFSNYMSELINFGFLPTSLMAAFIFYMITQYYPKKIRKGKLKKIIDNEINIIFSLLSFNLGSTSNYSYFHFFNNGLGTKEYKIKSKVITKINSDIFKDNFKKTFTKDETNILLGNFNEISSHIYRLNLFNEFMETEDIEFFDKLLYLIEVNKSKEPSFDIYNNLFLFHKEFRKKYNIKKKLNYNLTGNYF